MFRILKSSRSLATAASGAAIALALSLPSPADAQPFGGWLALDGSLGYVEIPDHGGLRPYAGFTFEAWIRRNEAQTGCQSIAGNNYENHWWVGICNSKLRTYTDGSGTQLNGGTIPVGVWTHVAVAWANGTLHHYVNGAETAAEIRPKPTWSDQEMRIGSDLSWGPTPSAAIDEVRLWNVGRTKTQILASMHDPITGPVSGLVAVWPFDGNARDRVSVHNGTEHGSVAYGVPAPPAGPWLATSELPGFRVKIRIAGGLAGAEEPDCVPETLCVSGAIPGRSEVFVRIVGPKPNGFLWPNLVKFSTSLVEAWIEQTATGEIRYYNSAGPWPGVDDLPGLYDRFGFLP